MRETSDTNRIRAARPRTRAVTLVEVLVALAIAAVLLALVLPVFARARARARTTACVSSLRSSALAFQMYADDHDGAFPTYLADARAASAPGDLVYAHDHFCQGLLSGGAAGINWATATMPYVVSGRAGANAGPLFLCPQDRQRGRSFFTSYEYKLWLAQGRVESEVEFPAAMALLWEQWDFHEGGAHAEHDRRAVMNMLFVDSHVRFIRLSETTTARYGEGPNLHGRFPGAPGVSNVGMDVGI